MANAVVRQSHPFPNIYTQFSRCPSSLVLKASLSQFNTFNGQVCWAPVTLIEVDKIHLCVCVCGHVKSPYETDLLEIAVTKRSLIPTNSQRTCHWKAEQRKGCAGVRHPLVAILELSKYLRTIERERSCMYMLFVLMKQILCLSMVLLNVHKIICFDS